MNAPDPVVHAAAQTIPLGLIVPSSTNPRKRFDPTQLSELTESVRQHGVLQPILVRATTDAPSALRPYEIVAGERRYRAAKAAGLEEILAVVRTLTDVQALELQVVENLQRADLHPLEEAEGYEQLLKLQAYAAEDLAAKVGKSRAYVYARLKLCALTPTARNAFYDGKLNPSTALLVARIPVRALQDKAVKEITDEKQYGGPMSVRTCMRHLQEHYMLRLADAPFPMADEKLLASAGSCAACPKRTGNDADLFDDVKSADVCTDPECFDAKKTAHVVRLRAAAEAKGQKVISGKEAKKIISYDQHIDRDSGYIGLDDNNYNDAKNRTYRQILGSKCPTPTLIETARGTLVEAVRLKEVSEQIKVPARAGDDYNAQQKKREAKAKLETAIRSAVFRAVAEKHPGTMTPADASLIAVALWDRTDHDVAKRILQLWEPEALAKAKDHQIYELRKSFAKRITSMPVPDLCRLMVQCSLGNEVYAGGYNSSKPERLNATAERLGVDHTAIRSELTKAGQAKQQAKLKKAAGAKKATKKPKKTAAPAKSTKAAAA